MQMLKSGTTMSDGTEKLLEEVKKKTLRVLKRSLYVLRVDTGSCNGCEIEIFAATSPLYDVERFGIRIVVSPRHADALLVTGPVTRQFRPILERVYQMTPDPKVVIAVGACGCGGGVWYNAYAVEGGVDQVIPVDVYIPGCPPHPAAILHGILVALDILEQKIRKTVYREESSTTEWRLKPPVALVLKEDTAIKMPWDLFKTIRLTARRYLGYIYGEQLVKDYVSMLNSLDDIARLEEESKKLVAAWSDEPRIMEVVQKLNEIVTRYFAETKR